jgi:NAD+ synthase
MPDFKFAVVQMNPIVGDLDGNFNQHIQYITDAVAKGADMVLFPEMSLTGYPLEDLVLRRSFMNAVEDKIFELGQWIINNHPNIGVVFGAPQQTFDGAIYNSAIFMAEGLQQDVTKYELPNYGVFDEKRVFSQGGEPWPINFRGHVIGLMICEDCWFPTVSKTLHEKGAAMLISINGSPYEMGKNVTRRQVIANRIKETGLPFMYANMVGGQDELVFDGGSFFWDGKTLQEAPYFQAGIFMMNVTLETRSSHFNADGFLVARSRDDGSFAGWIGEPDAITLEGYPEVQPTGIQEVYQAIVLGTKDYMTKQKSARGKPLFLSAVLGYSGGVDSGIVAAVACDALGAENVHLVRLPSKYSSEGSLTDAADGAQRLGAPMRTIEIEPVVEALRSAYWSQRAGYNFYNHKQTELQGVADENIQARARGNLLMAISNQEGHLLLTTGNKSEVSVGYSTLYGDMSGGYNPIKDAYKTTVWELCRWRNNLTQADLDAFGFKGRVGDVVPEAIISKPPSAELRPDQKDEDSLPPYPVLDALLKGMIEKEQSMADLIAEGFNPEEVTRIRNLVDNAEYKRRQAAPGVKLTSKIHGRDRRYPIVNAWRA